MTFSAKRLNLKSARISVRKRLLALPLIFGLVILGLGCCSHAGWAQVTEASVRSHMEALASDAMRGRGSASPDEYSAAVYIGEKLHSYGIEPGGDIANWKRGYLQAITIKPQSFAAPPVLSFNITGPRNAAPPSDRAHRNSRRDGGLLSNRSSSSQSFNWTHGNEFLLMRTFRSVMKGPLQKVSFSGDLNTIRILPDAIVLLYENKLDEDRLNGKNENKQDKDDGASGQRAATHAPRLTEIQFSQQLNDKVAILGQKGAVAAMFRATPEMEKQWARRKRAPKLATSIDDLSESEMMGSYPAVIALSPVGALELSRLPDKTAIQISGKVNQQTRTTWNVVGILPGADPNQKAEAILLSAHLDHLGVGTPVKGDAIYNGADDDASGVTAVLELAEKLGKEPRPKRTVIFAFFGSEETGGFGATYFRERPPVALGNIIANLEFEMIGRPDKAVPPHTLWLTGYDRSNLGPELRSHGARLVADPHPKEQFFNRSDNYTLAKRGVVAHTVSSFGLHHDYHQPSDDLAHIDFAHMTDAIESMVGPVEWLVNTDFRPVWNPGQRP